MGKDQVYRKKKKFTLKELELKQNPSFVFNVKGKKRMDESLEPSRTQDYPDIYREYWRAKGMKTFRTEFVNIWEKEFGACGIQGLDTFQKYLNVMVCAQQEERTTKDPICCRPEVAFETKVISHDLLYTLPSTTYMSKRDRKDPMKSLETLYRYAVAVEHSLNLVSPDDPVALGSCSYYPSEEKDVLNPDQIREIIQRVKQQAQNNLFTTIDGTETHLNLKKLRSMMTPFYEKYVGKRIQNFCIRVSEMCHSIVKQIEEKVNQITDDGSNASPLLMMRKGKFYFLSYQDDKQKISKIYYEKLRKLYSMHNPFDKNLIHFHPCLYVCLRRYATFSVTNSSTLHATLPAPVFNILHKELKVTQDCFSSPFNNFFPNFNSPFFDVDRHFGSKGNFFDFNMALSGGSFELAPSFIVPVMDRAVQKISIDLQNASQPLQFVIFLPDWIKPPFTALEILEKSPFKTGFINILPKQHCWTIGNQHTMNGLKNHFLMSYGVRIYILQNEKAKEICPITDSVVDSLRTICMDTSEFQ